MTLFFYSWAKLHVVSQIGSLPLSLIAVVSEKPDLSVVKLDKLLATGPGGQFFRKCTACDAVVNVKIHLSGHMAPMQISNKKIVGYKTNIYTTLEYLSGYQKFV